MSFPKWVLPLSPSSSESQCPCFSWEVLQNHQVVLTQALFELLPLCWRTQGVKFCVYTLWVKSATYISLGLLNLSPAGFQKPNIFGAYLPGARFLGWGPQCGLELSDPWRETSKIVVSSYLCVTDPGLRAWLYPKRHLFFSLSSSLCSFFISLVVVNHFYWSSVHSHRSCSVVSYNFGVLVGGKFQGLSTLPS